MKGNANARPEGELPNVVNLVGGLGNQLFQLLFGTMLERQTGRRTVYDTSSFMTYRPHDGFALERAFDIQVPDLESSGARIGPGWMRSYLSKRALRRFPVLGHLVPSVQPEDDRFAFPQARPTDRARIFLGTWQSQPYGQDDLQAFAAQLRFREAVTAASAAGAESIGGVTAASAAIHVRLGDYLTNGKGCHLPLAEGYYRNVIDRILEEGRASHFYVFSDRIEQVRGWFEGRPVTFMAGYEGQNAFSDLHLLSRFPTMILSASTFAWWAAVFSGTGTRVYYPSPWVRPEWVSLPKYTAIAMPGWIPADSRGYDLERDARG